jgi:hypothetical protein
MIKTLKTLVLKTAKVTSVKLLTPADRIGQGFDFAYPSPTDNLSHGHVPVPVPNNPEPEQVRSRQLSAMRMQQQQMQLQQYQADNSVVTPAGLGRTGCIPGSSTGRFAASTATALTTKRTSWRATRTAVEGRANASLASVVCRTTVTSRAKFPGDLRDCLHDRFGRDCQSLRRLSGTSGKSEKRVARIIAKAMREISPIAAVGK